MTEPPPFDQPVTTVAAAMLAAWDAGLCPVPAAADGSKRPIGKWKDYQTTRAERAVVVAWGERPGWGIICGRVSRYVEMLELEGRAVAEGYFERLRAACHAAGCGAVFEAMVAGYMEQTPSGGLHILFGIIDGDNLGNTKLARRRDSDDPTKILVLIETRGEGGYVVLAPSNGVTHPTGLSWTIVSGSLEEIVFVTVAERDAVYAVCRSFDEMAVREVAPVVRAPIPLHVGGDRWLDDLVAGIDRRPWADVLGRYGFTLHHVDDGETYWTRPDKDTAAGWSATTNATGNDRMIVFSSSMEIEGWDGSPPAPSYDRLDVIAAYEYGGDRLRAARALAGRVEIHPDGSPPPQLRILPDDFWDARCVLSIVRRAALSRMISPDAVLGAVLARCVAMSHHTVTLPAIVGRVGGPELFVANVAAPGIGKGSSMDVAAELILAPHYGGITWLAGDFVEAPVGSGEGIVKLFFKMVDDVGPSGKPIRVQRQASWNVLLRIDEVESLERLGKRQDQTTMTVLRSAWSRETLGAAYADNEKDRRLPAGQYRLGVVMGVQPSAAGFLIDDTGTGTPQRFVYVSGMHPAINEHDLPDWPGPIEWFPTRDGGHLDVATSIAIELRARHGRAARGEEPDPMGAHGGLRQLKTAAALAMLDSRRAVTVEDWQLAAVISATSDNVRDGLRADIARERRQRDDASDSRAGRRREYELKAEETVTVRRIEQGAATLVARLGRVGEPMAWRDLRDSLGRYKRDAVAIREHAVEAGLIIENEEGKWTLP
jgi:hypothetical protein